MRSDRIIGVVCLLVAGVYLAAGLGLAGEFVGDAGGLVGPAAYPRALALLCALLSIALIAWPDRTRPDKQAVAGSGLARSGAVFLVGIGHITLLPLFGFLLTSAVSVPTLMLLTGERRSLMILASSVLTIGAIYGLFRYVLIVLLPSGTVFGT